MIQKENEMLIAILDVSKQTENATYFKGASLGLNSISANLKNGKLYISIVKWPKKDQPGSGQFAEEDAPF